MISGHVIFVILIADSLDGQRGADPVGPVPANERASLFRAVIVPQMPAELGGRPERRGAVRSPADKASLPGNDIAADHTGAT